VRALQVLGLTLVGSQFLLFACATAQDQSGLPTNDSGGSPSGAEGGTAAVGGSAPSASGSGGQLGNSGSTGSAGTTGNAGGTGNMAFGGSNGIPTGGSAGQAGTAGAHGGATGTAGAGGSNTGGHGGTTGGGAGGTSGGGHSGAATGGGTSSGGSGGSLACLASWQGSSCDTCSTQTQADHKACSVVLQCYADNACSPTACGALDQKCGQNTLQIGSAAYQIANMVYSCLCTAM